MTQDELIDFAGRLGLGPAAQLEIVPLSGGVSSDVWKVVGPGGAACIKRALPSLKVSQRWDVPVSRGLFEARWLHTAAGIVPTHVPQLLAYDENTHLIAMEFFPAESFVNWRSELLEGRVDQNVARTLGHVIGTIHARTAHSTAIATRFNSGELFDSLRLDPYFRSVRNKYPDLAGRLDAIIERTASTHHVLVHGDVSPKNILVGESGPVLLDAECAWYGDPAFDVAFLCTHLLLKARLLPAHAHQLHTCFGHYLDAYESHVSWEPLPELRQRSAHLLAAMLLARIDGKSPVDYLSESERVWVRNFATLALRNPCSSPRAIQDSWRLEPSPS